MTAAGAALCVIAGWGGPPLWAVPALAAAVALGESSTARLVIGRQGVSIGLTDAFIAVAFLLRPGAWSVLAVVLGVLISLMRKLEPIKVAFNLALFVCSVGAGLAVNVSLADGLLARYGDAGALTSAAIGLIVFSATNFMLVAIPVSLFGKRRYRDVLQETTGVTLIHISGNLSLGLLGAWLFDHAPFGLLGLLAPLTLLWWSYRQQTERAAEAKLFAELASGQEQASTASSETSAQVIISAAARLFGGAEVEMVLRHPDGLVRYVGDENGLIRRERTETDAFAEPWAVQAIMARGVRTGTEGERPYCSAVLGDPDSPLAVLIARRPARAGAFARIDARLAEVLVHQAEAWLSVADLASKHGAAVGKIAAYDDATRKLGDLGAETVPSLMVLRESADRLARLAYHFEGPDPLRDIVSELHSAERAVASLLGAIALTSEPELVTGELSDAPALDRSHHEGLRSEMFGDGAQWTTTGRLDASEVR
jgi:hypothetical protein